MSQPDWIYFVNATSHVGAADFGRMVAAVQIQLDRDFCPAHRLGQVELIVVHMPFGTAPIGAPIGAPISAPVGAPVGAPVSVPHPAPLALVPPDGCPVVLVLDSVPVSGAAGYHEDVAGERRPVGRVAAPVGQSLLRGADSAAVTLSHEALETVLDRTCSLWYDCPDGQGDAPQITWTEDDGTVEVAAETSAEACDPVEDDCYPVTLPDGTVVDVSNFVTPAYWDLTLLGSKVDTDRAWPPAAGTTSRWDLSDSSTFPPAPTADAAVSAVVDTHATPPGSPATAPPAGPLSKPPQTSPDAPQSLPGATPAILVPAAPTVPVPTCGKFDFMGLLRAPFGLRPGGYLILRSAVGVGRISLPDGAHPARLLDKLLSPHSRLSRRLGANSKVSVG